MIFYTMASRQGGAIALMAGRLRNASYIVGSRQVDENQGHEIGHQNSEPIHQILVED